MTLICHVLFANTAVMPVKIFKKQSEKNTDIRSLKLC